MLHEPIGIFDSGLGGLSVMKAVRRLLPAEDLFYFGDCHFAPYGDQTVSYITERVFTICDYMLEKGAKAIVVACNTATAAAVNKIRLHYEIPIIGIEPAIKPAVAATEKGAVGVLATTRTITSERYKHLIEKYGKDSVDIISVACPGLMDCVESGDWDSKHTRELISKYCKKLKRDDLHEVVLGCTHYPFLMNQIRQELGKSVHLIDPSDAVARELKHQLSIRSKLKGEGKGSELFMITGDPIPYQPVVNRLWGYPVKLLSAPKVLLDMP